MATTTWIYRELIIAPAIDADLLNALWTCIGPEVEGELHTFTVPLSADGVHPATHLGMNTAATLEMHELISEHLGQEGPGVTRHVLDAASSVLVETTSSGALWDWLRALEHAGLQLVQEVI